MINNSKILNKNIKNLSLNLEKINQYKNPDYTISYYKEVESREISKYHISNLPPLPLNLKKELNENCSICPYNLNNRATLLEFGKLVDMEDFNKKSFFGGLGTDTRFKCSLVKHFKCSFKNKFNNFIKVNKL